MWKYHSDFSFELASLQELQEAILETQKNAKIEVVEDTPSGK